MQWRRKSLKKQNACNSCKTADMLHEISILNIYPVYNHNVYTCTYI